MTLYLVVIEILIKKNLMKRIIIIFVVKKVKKLACFKFTYVLSINYNRVAYLIDIGIKV